MGLGVFADSGGVPFDRYREMLPARAADFPPPCRITDPEVVLAYREQWTKCQVCGAHGRVILECHHIIGGTKGRSDEVGNLIVLDRRCHERLGPHSEENLGTILFWKWATDRGTLSWVRLAILHRRFLPDLVVDRLGYRRWSRDTLKGG